MGIELKLSTFGFLATTLLGMASLLLGKKVAAALGYPRPLDPLGEIEFRATYGSFFIALGIAGIYFNNPEVNLAVGLAWLAAGLTRFALILLQRHFITKNAVGLAVEIGIALLLLL